MAILNVDSKLYGRPLSTVFGSPSKTMAHMMDDDPDPILQDLRTLNYRYVRFYFHPLVDKFLLCNGWKDPLWTDVRAIRAGIDSEEKSYRDLVVGKNLIDIEEKSAFRLLVDEVSVHPVGPWKQDLSSRS
jgi:cation-transporting P-type ATPase 13A2